MSKKELMKLADSFQKKADTAFQNYQETGASRYDSAFRRKVEQAWKAGEYVLSAEDFAGVSFNTGS